MKSALAVRSVDAKRIAETNAIEIAAGRKVYGAPCTIWCTFEMLISRSASAYHYHNARRLSCKNAIDLGRSFVEYTPFDSYYMLGISSCQYRNWNVQRRNPTRIVSAAVSQTGDNLRRRRKRRFCRLTLRQKGRPVEPSQKIYAFLNFRRAATHQEDSTRRCPLSLPLIWLEKL